MFLRHGLTLAATGVIAGLAMALTLMRFMSSLLFGIGSWMQRPTSQCLPYSSQPETLPALCRRAAAAVDPVETLKAE